MIHALISRWVSRFLAAASISVLTLGAASCGETAAPSTPAASASAAVAQSPSPAPVSRSGSLVVYSGRSEALVAPLIKQFSDATGIKVEVKYGSTGAMAATLLEEGARTPADVFFAQDPGGLGAVREAMARLPEDLLGLVPEWARSPDGRWVGISGRARVVAYNAGEYTEADLPDSILGFTAPEWKGKIGWAPTNASLQAMVASMRILWGDEETLMWLKRIQANEPRVYPGNAQAVAGVAAGEVGVAFVNHYYLFQFLAEQGDSFNARNYFTRAGDAGSVVLVAGAAITAEAAHSEEAEKLLRFMLSDTGQRYFADKTYEYPLIAGVPQDPKLPDIADIRKPDLDVSRLEDISGTQALMRQAGNIP